LKLCNILYSICKAENSPYSLTKSLSFKQVWLSVTQFTILSFYHFVAFYPKDMASPVYSWYFSNWASMLPTFYFSYTIMLLGT